MLVSFAWLLFAEKNDMHGNEQVSILYLDDLLDMA